MKPLLSRLIIKALPPQEKVGAIYIPERSRMQPQEGTVVAVGPKVTDIAVGDQVLFGKFSIVPFPGWDHHYLVWERDVMVVLE